MIFTKFLPVMPKIMLMLLLTDYAQNYAGIMCVSLYGVWRCRTVIVDVRTFCVELSQWTCRLSKWKCGCSVQRITLLHCRSGCCHRMC